MATPENSRLMYKKPKPRVRILPLTLTFFFSLMTGGWASRAAHSSMSDVLIQPKISNVSRHP